MNLKRIASMLSTMVPQEEARAAIDAAICAVWAAHGIMEGADMDAVRADLADAVAACGRASAAIAELRGARCAHCGRWGCAGPQGAPSARERQLEEAVEALAGLHPSRSCGALARVEHDAVVAIGGPMPWEVVGNIVERARTELSVLRKHRCQQR